MENYLDLGSESETYIQNKGQYQTSINGKVVDNTKWKVAYDGDELDLEAKRNNEAVYMKLNNEDIMKLLEVPSYHKPIRERLEFDLQPENKIDIRPIIMEELRQISGPNQSKHIKKPKKVRKTKKAKKASKSSRGESKSKSKRKSKKHSRSKNKSKSKEEHHKVSAVTPDYLKTIY
tara:strand:- start:23 stop:550 length:528 start_codon:yes stop_codon:yes gene_type:complete